MRFRKYELWGHGQQEYLLAVELVPPPPPQPALPAPLGTLGVPHQVLWFIGGGLQVGFNELPSETRLRTGVDIVFSVIYAQRAWMVPVTQSCHELGRRSEQARGRLRTREKLVLRAGLEEKARRLRLPLMPDSVPLLVGARGEEGLLPHLDMPPPVVLWLCRRGGCT